MNTGSVLAQFTITLSKAVNEPVSVDWFTSDGTAKAGVDYAANKGTAVFAAGETSKTVDILVYGRAVGSEDRSFFVEMLPPTNAILGAAIGECVIHVDTTGSQPVTEVIIPTGPRGIQGKSSYQTWLDLGNSGTEQDFINSLKPSAEDIADEVIPLLNVGDAQITASGTESLSKPDQATVKALARRIAYAGAVKIATATLADGDNLLALSNLTGDTVNFMAGGFVPRILKGGVLTEPQWSVDSAGKLLIKAAQAGSILYAVQYDFSSLNNRTARATELTDFIAGLASSSDANKGDKLIGVKRAVTGAVARTQHDINAESVSVLDFGAKGDGVADDAAAINKAAASGRTVAFPDGVYLCKSVINVTADNVKFQGSRKAILKLNATGQAGDNGILVKANNFGTEGLTLETVVRGIAIQVTPVSSAGLKGVKISGTAFENVFYSVRCGLGVNDANNWRVSDIQIINCKSTAPVGENAGHFLCTKSDDILYQGNTVFNGKNSSAYGVAKCTRIAIMNNFEYGVEDSLNDVEAAIQIEDSPNSKTTIMGNICNHDIWISGGQDVIVSGNKCRELRATVGNPDDQGGNRIKFIGNNAGSIRCSKYGEYGEGSASIILTETEFANNTLDPASYNRNGQAIQYAIYIDATDFVGKLIFTGNKVISNSAGSCISLNRASNALVLHALFNDFGSQNHSYSGTLGYIYEQGNANPMFKGASVGGNYIAAGLLGNLTANQNTWTAFQLANELTDVNSEFVSGLFTPKASGIYRFSGIVTAQPGGAGSQIGFRLVQASAEIARLAFLRSADNGSLGVPLRTVDIYLAAGASVQVEYFVTGGTVILASDTNTMLNISRVA